MITALLSMLVACGPNGDPPPDDVVGELVLVLTPAEPTSADDVRVSWEGGEGEAIWTRLGDDEVTVDGLVLPATATRFNETWAVDVNMGALHARTTVLIAPAPAPPIQVTLSDQAPIAEDDDLVCSWAFTEPHPDAGAEPTVTVGWNVDGNDIPGRFFVNPGLVPADWLRSGERWTCHVTLEGATGGATASAAALVRSRIGVPTVQLPAGDYMFGIHPDRSPELSYMQFTYVQVSLSRDFELAITELTEQQRTEIMGGFAPACADCAYAGGSWNDMARILNYLSISEGLQHCYVCDRPIGHDCLPIEGSPYDCNGYRFPTTVEWQYAARDLGTNTDGFPNGRFADPAIDHEVREDCRDVMLATGVPISAVARTCAEAADLPLRVGQRLPTRLGLYDITGNVEELTSDIGIALNPPDRCHQPAIGPCKVVGGADFYFHIHLLDSTSLAGLRGAMGGYHGRDWRHSVIDVYYYAVQGRVEGISGLRLARTLPVRPFRFSHPILTPPPPP